MFTVILKTIVIYFVLVISFRLLGKREIGELSLFDLVILLIIADIASIGLDNDKFFLPCLVSLFVLILLQKLISVILLKIPVLRGIIDGNPKVLIIDGKINYDAMKKEFYNIDDLIFQLHQNHVMDISEVKLAILETSGTLSVFRNSRFNYLSLPIIVSGKFDNYNIKMLDLNCDYLKIKFEQNSIELKRIIYASYQEGIVIYFYSNKKEKGFLKPNILDLEQ